MKNLLLLLALCVSSGCSDRAEETRSTGSGPGRVAAPLVLGDHVLGQLDEQKQNALERKSLVDGGIDGQ